MDSTLQDTGTQIIQVIPEQYQPMAMTLFSIAMGLLSIGALLWPFISKWASNRQIAAINDNSITQADISNALEEKLNLYRKADTIKKISEWEYKLLYATTEEAKDMCNAEITRLKAELDSYN